MAWTTKSYLSLDAIDSLRWQRKVPSEPVYQAVLNLRRNTVLKQAQFGIWNRKQRKAATETDHKVRE